MTTMQTESIPAVAVLTGATTTPQGNPVVAQVAMPVEVTAATTMQNGQAEAGVALITGATGIQGSHLLARLTKSDRWSKIYAVSRRPPSVNSEKVTHLPVNLDEAPVEVLDQLSNAGANDVTHIFYTAFVETGDEVKNAEVNPRMFKTLIESVERAGSKLKHIYLTTGLKWYGQLFPQNKTPYKETDPRHFPPDFYYNQEDYLASRLAEGASWTYNVLRPGPICGFSEGSFMNIVTSTALYCTLCKELNIGVLRFPGPPSSYNYAVDMIDVDLLVDAEEWLATHVKPDTANTAFNITNGDVTRWKHIWPRIAEWFGMPVGEPMQIPLNEYMRDKGADWDKIVEKYGLNKDFEWGSLGTWTFAEFVYQQPTDWFANTNKLKRAGFNKMTVDTEDMWVRKMQQLAADGIIPNYPKLTQAGTAKHAAGQMDPTRLDRSGQEAQVPMPANVDQAAAGYGAKSTSRSQAQEAGSVPSSRTQEGGLVPSNNITADQSGLEPMVPLTPDLNFEKAAAGYGAKSGPSAHAQEPGPMVSGITTADQAGNAPTLTPDVNAEKATRDYGAFQGTTGGNGAPASRDDTVPPGDRLRADQLLGQV